MNEERAKRGIGVERVVEALIRTFNAQDQERHAETLNYPHIRFCHGKFTTRDLHRECGVAGGGVVDVPARG